MKKHIVSIIILVFSLTFVTSIWGFIKIPYGESIQIFGQSYLKNLYNPLNDKLRFIIFLIVPFLSLVIFYQFSEKNFFLNLKNLLFINFSQINLEDKEIKKFFWIFLIIIIFEFLSLDFTKFKFYIDIFHEGLWLSASQNTLLSEKFWTSSYIGRGFFGNFHPYFIWKLFEFESIGLVRFFHLFIILLNKILLLIIAKKITEMTYFSTEKKLIYFTILSVFFLFFTSYGEPVFIFRSFLLLIFIIILLSFFSNYQSKKLIFLLALISSVSLFWFIDIGFYINFISLILIIFFLIRFEFKNFLFFIFSSFICWSIILLIIPKDEFEAFLNNTFLIISTIDYIHGLIYPTPFSGDFRSTRALLIFLTTGLLIILLVRKLNSKNILFLFSIIFLFLIGLIYFNYALSRSDSVHIRIGQGFVYIPFFSVSLYLILKFFLNKKIFNYKIYLLLVFLFLILNSIEKKYEHKSINFVFSSFISIKKLLSYEDKSFLNEDYNKFISYYKKLTLSDKCVTIFTHEVALSYFLKKPTCSKYYLMFTALPKIIQYQLIEDINIKKPSYIIYNSDIDTYGSNKDSLKLVNNFIISNYHFYEKYNHWEIYKINDF